MPFIKNLPKWQAVGVEPPPSKQAAGWIPGDKPPADYLNWAQNLSYEALKELQEKAAEKVDLNAIGADLATHKIDTVKHITAAERTTWNTKQAALGYTPLNRAGDTATNLLLAADPTVPLGAVTKQFAEINFPKMSTANVTYYVLKTGSDSNTGLTNTAGGAFLTIAKARSMIPQICNHAYVINTGAGTYSEDVVFDGFSGKGSITLNGAASVLSDLYVANSLTINQCTCFILVTGFKFITTISAAVSVFRSIDTRITYVRINTAASQPGVFFYSALGTFSNSEISNRTEAITSTGASTVYSNSNSGTGNTVGLSSTVASTIGKNGPQPAGTTAEAVSAGGAIR